MVIDGQIELSIDLEEDFNAVQNFIQNIYLETKKNKFLFTTGEYGMLLFQRLIDKKFENKNFIKTITANIISTQKVNEQYVIYKLHNEIELKIKHNPNLDEDKDINEITGFPKKASRLYYEN